jgi:DNA-binding transcriptional LysR family regulator
VRIGLHELSTDETVEHVISGQVDFGVVSIRQKHAKLTIEPLYEERMQLVCAGDHVLAAQSGVSWEQAAAHPQISLHRSFSVRSTVDGIHARKGLDVASVIEAGSVLSVLALVQAGLGVAVLPGYIEGFATDLGLACRALPAADCSHPIALIQRWNARPSMAAGVMISLLKASLAGGRAGPARL